MIIVVSIAFFALAGSVFHQVGEKSENSQAEMERAKTDFQGVGSDLEQVATTLNATSVNAHWDSVTRKDKKESCTYSTFTINHSVITCEDGITANISASSQAEIDEAISTYRGVLTGGDIFSSMESRDGDQNSSQSRAVYVLDYNRWGVDTCTLTIESANDAGIQSTNNEDGNLRANLACTQKIQLGKDGTKID